MIAQMVNPIDLAGVRLNIPSNGEPVWALSTHGGRKMRRLDSIRFAQKMEELGAGEILLTSMDRDQDRNRMSAAQQPLTQRTLAAVSKPFQRRLQALSPKKTPLDLDSITFVPSSDACTYKESITAKGNGKARLRPMR